MLVRMVLEAKTPLSLRTGRNPARSETGSYVPGTSILGGLAHAHRMLKDDPVEFAQFFLRERIICGNCYPASFTTNGKPTLELSDRDDRPVLPIPLTARSYKRFSGFKFNAGLEPIERKGVTDSLIPLALFALSKETRPDVIVALDSNEEPHLALAAFSGFFRQGMHSDQIGKSDQPKGLRTRTGIDYRTGTVRSTILYSRQTLPEGMPFWGAWRIDDDLWGTFEAFLQQATGQGLLRVGNNKTRGFGRITLDPAALDDDSEAAIRARVEAFTATFKQAAQVANIAATAAAYVPVTLTSDAILYDPLLRARLRLNTADLAGITHAELVFHAAGMRQVRGWNALWGLPKADDWAITMGSVFLFALNSVDDQTYTSLLRLQQQGIGERRSEGFGMVTVAHPFHTELAGRFV